MEPSQSYWGNRAGVPELAESYFNATGETSSTAGTFTLTAGLRGVYPETSRRDMKALVQKSVLADRILCQLRHFMIHKLQNIDLHRKPSLRQCTSSSDIEGDPPVAEEDSAHRLTERKCRNAVPSRDIGGDTLFAACGNRCGIYGPAIETAGACTAATAAASSLPPVLNHDFSCCRNPPSSDGFACVSVSQVNGSAPNCSFPASRHCAAATVLATEPIPPAVCLPAPKEFLFSSHNRPLPLRLKCLVSLLLDCLKYNGFLYTYSVLQPEAGLQDTDLLSTSEMCLVLQVPEDVLYPKEVRRQFYFSQSDAKIPERNPTCPCFSRAETPRRSCANDAVGTQQENLSPAACCALSVPSTSFARIQAEIPCLSSSIFSANGAANTAQSLLERIVAYAADKCIQPCQPRHPPSSAPPSPSVSSRRPSRVLFDKGSGSCTNRELSTVCSTAAAGQNAGGCRTRGCSRHGVSSMCCSHTSKCCRHHHRGGAPVCAGRHRRSGSSCGMHTSGSRLSAESNRCCNTSHLRCRSQPSGNSAATVQKVAYPMDLCRENTKGTCSKIHRQRSRSAGATPRAVLMESHGRAAGDAGVGETQVLLSGDDASSIGRMGNVTEGEGEENDLSPCGRSKQSPRSRAASSPRKEGTPQRSEAAAIATDDSSSSGKTIPLHKRQMSELEHVERLKHFRLQQEAATARLEEYKQAFQEQLEHLEQQINGQQEQLQQQQQQLQQQQRAQQQQQELNKKAFQLREEGLDAREKRIHEREQEQLEEARISKQTLLLKAEEHKKSVELELQDSFAKLQKERVQLQQQRHDLELAEQKAAEAASVLKAQVGEQQQLVESNKKLSAACEEKTRQIEQLQEQLRLAHDTGGRQIQQLEMQLQELQSLRRENAQLVQHIARAREVEAERQNVHARTIGELKESLRECRLHAQDLKQKIADLEGKLATAQREKERAVCLVREEMEQQQRQQQQQQLLRNELQQRQQQAREQQEAAAAAREKVLAHTRQELEGLTALRTDLRDKTFRGGVQVSQNQETPLSFVAGYSLQQQQRDQQQQQEYHQRELLTSALAVLRSTAEEEEACYSREQRVKAYVAETQQQGNPSCRGIGTGAAAGASEEHTSLERILYQLLESLSETVTREGKKEVGLGTGPVVRPGQQLEEQKEDQQQQPSNVLEEQLKQQEQKEQQGQHAIDLFFSETLLWNNPSLRAQTADLEKRVKQFLSSMQLPRQQEHEGEQQQQQLQAQRPAQSNTPQPPRLQLHEECLKQQQQQITGSRQIRDHSVCFAGEDSESKEKEILSRLNQQNTCQGHPASRSFFNGLDCTASCAFFCSSNSSSSSSVVGLQRTATARSLLKEDNRSGQGALDAQTLNEASFSNTEYSCQELLRCLSFERSCPLPSTANDQQLALPRSSSPCFAATSPAALIPSTTSALSVGARPPTDATVLSSSGVHPPKNSCGAAAVTASQKRPSRTASAARLRPQSSAAAPVAALHMNTASSIQAPTFPTDRTSRRPASVPNTVSSAVNARVSPRAVGEGGNISRSRPFSSVGGVGTHTASVTTPRSGVLPADNMLASLSLLGSQTIPLLREDRQWSSGEVPSDTSKDIEHYLSATLACCRANPVALAAAQDTNTTQSSALKKIEAARSNLQKDVAQADSEISSGVVVSLGSSFEVLQHTNPPHYISKQQLLLSSLAKGEQQPPAPQFHQQYQQQQQSSLHPQHQRRQYEKDPREGKIQLSRSSGEVTLQDLISLHMAADGSLVTHTQPVASSFASSSSANAEVLALLGALPTSAATRQLGESSAQTQQQRVRSVQQELVEARSRGQQGVAAKQQQDTTTQGANDVVYVHCSQPPTVLRAMQQQSGYQGERPPEDKEASVVLVRGDAICMGDSETPHPLSHCERTAGAAGYSRPKSAATKRLREAVDTQKTELCNVSRGTATLNRRKVAGTDSGGVKTENELTTRTAAKVDREVAVDDVQIGSVELEEGEVRSGEQVLGPKGQELICSQSTSMLRPASSPWVRIVFDKNGQPQRTPSAEVEAALPPRQRRETYNRKKTVTPSAVPGRQETLAGPAGRYRRSQTATPEKPSPKEKSRALSSQRRVQTVNSGNPADSQVEEPRAAADAAMQTVEASETDNGAGLAASPSSAEGITHATFHPKSIGVQTSKEVASLPPQEKALIRTRDEYNYEEKFNSSAPLPSSTNAENKEVAVSSENGTEALACNDDPAASKTPEQPPGDEVRDIERKGNDSALTPTEQKRASSDEVVEHHQRCPNEDKSQHEGSPNDEHYPHQGCATDEEYRHQRCPKETSPAAQGIDSTVVPIERQNAGADTDSGAPANIAELAERVFFEQADASLPSTPETLGICPLFPSTSSYSSCSQSASQARNGPTPGASAVSVSPAAATAGRVDAFNPARSADEGAPWICRTKNVSPSNRQEFRQVYADQRGHSSERPELPNNKEEQQQQHQQQDEQGSYQQPEVQENVRKTPLLGSILHQTPSLRKSSTQQTKCEASAEAAATALHQPSSKSLICLPADIQRKASSAAADDVAAAEVRDVERKGNYSALTPTEQKRTSSDEVVEHHQRCPNDDKSQHEGSPNDEHYPHQGCATDEEYRHQRCPNVGDEEKNHVVVSGKSPAAAVVERRAVAISPTKLATKDKTHIDEEEQAAAVARDRERRRVRVGEGGEEDERGGGRYEEEPVLHATECCKYKNTEAPLGDAFCCVHGIHSPCSGAAIQNYPHKHYHPQAYHGEVDVNTTLMLPSQYAARHEASAAYQQPHVWQSFFPSRAAADTECCVDSVRRRQKLGEMEVDDSLRADAACQPPQVVCQGYSPSRARLAPASPTPRRPNVAVAADATCHCGDHGRRWQRLAEVEEEDWGDREPQSVPNCEIPGIPTACAERAEATKKRISATCSVCSSRAASPEPLCDEGEVDDNYPEAAAASLADDRAFTAAADPRIKGPQMATTAAGMIFADVPMGGTAATYRQRGAAATASSPIIHAGCPAPGGSVSTYRQTSPTRSPNSAVSSGRRCLSPVGMHTSGKSSVKSTGGAAAAATVRRSPRSPPRAGERSTVHTRTIENSGVRGEALTRAVSPSAHQLPMVTPRQPQQRLYITQPQQHCPLQGDTQLHLPQRVHQLDAETYKDQRGPSSRKTAGGNAVGSSFAVVLDPSVYSLRTEAGPSVKSTNRKPPCSTTTQVVPAADAGRSPGKTTPSLFPVAPNKRPSTRACCRQTPLQ